MQQGTVLTGPVRVASRLTRVLTPSRRRAIFHGLVLGGWLFVVLNIPRFIEAGLPGRDAITYWIVDPANPYRGNYGAIEFFPYSPPAALVSSLLAALPWPVFLVAWWGVLLGVLAWIGGSWRSLIVLLAIPPVFLDVLYGNIHVLLAAAVVLGFRWPVAWSFVLLTKITPGIGLLWFAIRREWRALILAGAATIVISGAAFLVAPGLWTQWFGALTAAQAREIPWGHAIAVPLPLRLAVAVPLVAWGAWTNRRWTVPVGATLALPVLWTAGLAMLVAVVAVRRDRLSVEPTENALEAAARSRDLPSAEARVGAAQP